MGLRRVARRKAPLDTWTVDKKGQEGTVSRPCLPLSGQCFDVYGVLYYTCLKLRNIAVAIFEFL